MKIFSKNLLNCILGLYGVESGLKPLIKARLCCSPPPTLWEAAADAILLQRSFKAMNNNYDSNRERDIFYIEPKTEESSYLHESIMHDVCSNNKEFIHH